MFLVYTSPDGEVTEIALGDRPISLGRSKTADITIHDEKASRLHCGIKREGNAITLRDLRSKNGTFVNEVKVEDSVELNPGDKIRIGSVVMKIRSDSVENDPGAETALQEVAKEMDLGKGYKTLLMELVDSANGDEAEKKRAKPKATKKS